MRTGAVTAFLMVALAGSAADAQTRRVPAYLQSSDDYDRHLHHVSPGAAAAVVATSVAGVATGLTPVAPAARASSGYDVKRVRAMARAATSGWSGAEAVRPRARRTIPAGATPGDLAAAGYPGLAAAPLLPGASRLTPPGLRHSRLGG